MPKTLTLTRLFDAPRDLMFAAFTDPRHVAGALAGMEQGWSESLDKLAELLGIH